MAKEKTFAERAKAVQETFNQSATARERNVRRQMHQIQHENEENFLKQFRRERLQRACGAYGLGRSS